MRCKKIKLFIVFIFLLFALHVFSYDNIVIHPKITGQAMLLYNKNADRKIESEQVSWIIDGAVAEDTDPRYLNHYYNPVNGQGLSGWDELYRVPIKVSGMPAKEWAKNQNSATGDYSIGAILKNYKEGDLKRAYQGIGHILHLIQDMAAPAHTRNDSHAMGDPYEEWAERYGTISLDKTKYIKVDSLDDAFDNLANYSNNNFVSKDSIININIDDYQKLEKEVNGVKIKYLIKNYESKNYKFCVFDDSSIRPIYKYNDDLYLNLDYWNMLYPQAVGYSAGVIDYFIKEFEQIDEEKSKMSFWDKISIAVSKILDTKENDKYLWGDIFLANRNVIADGWHNLTGVTGQAYDFSKLVVESGGEVINDAAQKSVKVLTDASGKVLSAIENPITAEDLFAPQKAKGGEDDGASVSRPEQEKVKVLSSEYSEDQGSLKADSVSRQDAGKIGVSYVIDGDTIFLTTGEKVRYIGIDTPELNNEGAQDDECLAWAARLRNMELLGKGELKLIKDPAVDKDKFGRLLRYVYSGDIFINEQLGREGLAKEFFCESDWQNCPVTADKNRQEIIQKAVDSAEQNKRGLFSGACEQEEMEDESENNKNKETVAEQTRGGNSAAKSSSAEQASPFVFGIGSPAPSIVSREAEQSGAGGEEQTGEQPENAQSEDENSQSSFGEDEEEELEEEMEEITPIITWFNLYDLTSSSTTRTASATVGVDLKIENQEPVNGYFLSMSSTTPEISAGGWAASSSEYFILPEENGEKTVYLWLKYGEGSITDATSSSIILDATAPEPTAETAVPPDAVDDSEAQHICATSTLTKPKRDWRGYLITQTLTADKSPYGFSGPIYLVGSDVLTIEPGVVIKFGGEYFYQWYMYPVIFHISGKIIAQGTEANPIVFTSIYDDSYCGDSNGDGAATAPKPGSWGGFQISSGNNIFDHVIIKYGGADKRGLITFHANTGNRITNSVFENNLRGIDFRVASSSNPAIIENNAFLNNSGGIIAVHESANPIIRYNNIYNNGAGIGVSDYATPLINYNNIYNNGGYGASVNQYYSLTQPVDARFNWWGHESGPYHKTLNPDGQGDKVGDKIDFNDWLSSEYK